MMRVQREMQDADALMGKGDGSLLHRARRVLQLTTVIMEPLRQEADSTRVPLRLRNTQEQVCSEAHVGQQ